MKSLTVLEAVANSNNAQSDFSDDFPVLPANPRKKYDPIEITDESTVDDYILREHYEIQESGRTFDVKRGDAGRVGQRKYEEAQERISLEQSRPKTADEALDALLKIGEISKASKASFVVGTEWDKNEYDPHEFKEFESVQNGTENFSVPPVPIEAPRFGQQFKPVTIENETTFKTISFDELLETQFTANWQVEELMEHGDLGLIFGKSGSGKSFFIQDLAFCVAAGLDFHGKKTTQSNVLYIAGEGFSGISKRFHALKKNYGCSASGLHFSCQPAAFMDKDSAKSVLEKINAIDNVGMVVIDTLHRNMGSGDENSSKDFAEFLNNIDNYVKSTGATVIIIHHSGHDATERARGSSSIRAALDIEYKIDKDDGDVLTLTNTKMKNHEPPKPMSFKFKQVQISESESSVILESTEFVAKSKPKILSNNSLKALQSLTNVIGTSGTNPPEIICNLFKDSPQNIPKTVVTIDQWRAAAYMAIIVDSDPSKNNKQDALKKGFQRCRGDLEKGGFIGMHGDYVWKIAR